MAEHMSKEAIAALYVRISSPTNLVYHVAHGRKENSDVEYDGEALIRIAGERVERDILKVRAASETFRDRSLPRPDAEEKNVSNAA